MSKIDELLKQYCPQGVIIKELWEVTIWDKRFNGVDKSKQQKVVSYKHVSSAILKSLKKEKGTVKLLSTGKFDGWTTEIEAGSNLNCGEVITIPSGGSANIKYYDGKFVDSGNILAKALDKTVSLKFIYYYLLSKNEIVESFFRGSGVKHPNMTELLKLQIPIPPLAIQEEIVNILDAFTTLETELEVELEARKKQYIFHRNRLFSFEGQDVEWKTLEELGEFTRGKRFVKTDIQSEGVPCIHYGEMYTHYKISAKEAKSYLIPTLASKLRKAKYGDVIIVAAGETIEDIGQGVAWLGDKEVVIHDACFAFSHNMHPNYVSHFTQTDIFHSQIKRYISSGKISSINAAGLSKAKIPFPSMEEQIRIASILDKFHTLLNDILIGLPAEIKARNKQYEYYRNQLLTFKQLNNE